MAITVKDVVNGTEITVNGKPPKFYSLSSGLTIQTTSQNAPTDLVNQYFVINTIQGKAVSLPFLFSDYTFIDSTLAAFTPTTVQEIYTFSQNVKGLRVVSGGSDLPTGASTEVKQDAIILELQEIKALLNKPIITATYNPPSIPDGVPDIGNIAAVGVVLGNNYVVSLATNITAFQGVIITAYVSANDTLTYEIYNNTGAAVDLPLLTFNIKEVV